MRDETTFAPDLLHRFVPTQHALLLQIGNRSVRLETNDIEIAAALQAMQTGDGTSTPGSTFLWKIVRDVDVTPVGPEMTLISTAELITITSGGTIICIDIATAEVLGFVAPNMSASAFVDSMVPVIIAAILTRTSA